MEKKNIIIGEKLKIGEAADILHVSTQTVRTWTDAGKLPVLISDGGHRFYIEDEVRKLALAGSGTTSYWTAVGSIRMNQHFKFTLFDDNSVDTSNFEAVSMNFDDRRWDFVNGLAFVPRTLAVTGKPVIRSAEYFLADLWSDYSKDYSQEPMVPEVMSAFEVASLIKEEIPRLIEQAVKQSMLFMKENLKPVPTIEWKSTSDKRVLMN